LKKAAVPRPEVESLDMFTFCVTKKVSNRLKLPLAQAARPSTNLLGNWYANILIIQRQHILLLVSERTLLPVLMPAKNIKSFPQKFSVELSEMLSASCRYARVSFRIL